MSSNTEISKFINVTIDKVDIPPIHRYFYINHYINHRIAKVILFYQFLHKHIKFSTIDDDIKSKIIRRLERSCYNNTINKATQMHIHCIWEDDNFFDLYHFTCARVLAYLSPDYNNAYHADTLITLLIKDNKLAKKIPMKTHKYFYPKEYIELHQRSSVGRKLHVKASKLRECPKCKQYLSTTKNIQNKSIDEDVTVIATCVFCEYEWDC